MPKPNMVPKNGHRIQGFSSETFIDAKELLESLDLEGSEVFMDLGCGDGHIAMEAVEMLNDDATVIAMDMYKPSIIDLHKDVDEQDIENLIPILGDITSKTELDDDSVDVMLMLNVYHHFNAARKVDEALSEIKRITKPGGRVCVMDYKKQEVRHGPPYQMRVDSEDVKKAFVDNGFKFISEDNEVGEDIPEGKSHYLLIFEK
ncbi:MAG: methyltransferase domain-containing protein [Methanobacteriaceae archaeon]|mgnify:CR=1 FL=1|nr:methyltransferase domain-containing protein [Methanobacteriaceae archaeon]